MVWRMVFWQSALNPSSASPRRSGYAALAVCIPPTAAQQLVGDRFGSAGPPCRLTYPRLTTFGASPAFPPLLDPSGPNAEVMALGAWEGRA